jgi:hypothetical protein
MEYKASIVDEILQSEIDRSNLKAQDESYWNINFLNEAVAEFKKIKDDFKATSDLLKTREEQIGELLLTIEVLQAQNDSLQHWKKHSPRLGYVEELKSKVDELEKKTVCGCGTPLGYHEEDGTTGAELEWCSQEPVTGICQEHWDEFINIRSDLEKEMWIRVSEVDKKIALEKMVKILRKAGWAIIESYATGVYEHESIKKMRAALEQTEDNAK